MCVKMAQDGSPKETVDSLAKEVEILKARLEEERQKLNDVSCEYCKTRFVVRQRLFLTAV